MLSLATFAVGFRVRPLGALFLSAYIDHIGRRRGLLATLIRGDQVRAATGT
jgi:MFS transporter, MHS family, citrate/tricarballylate:H+ symporter